MFVFIKGPTKRENIKSGLLWWDLKKKKVVEEREVRKMSPPGQRCTLVLICITDLDNWIYD